MVIYYLYVVINRQKLNIIFQSLREQPAAVILGPRQVGKTTLAKEIRKKLGRKCIFLDLENPQDLKKMSDGFTYLGLHSRACVIIDEVQQMPQLFTWLRPLIDAYRKPGRFLLLGSANPTLVKGVSESLAGSGASDPAFAGKDQKEDCESSRTIEKRRGARRTATSMGPFRKKRRNL